MPEKTTSKTTETFKIRGSELVRKIKELIKAGNVRRITVKDKSGRGILDIPLTFGVVGGLIAPALAVIATTVALIAECTITVEKEG